MDAWIPRRYDSRLGTHPVTHAQANMKLADWIDPRTKELREDEVKAALTQLEAQLVLAVPIPIIVSQDELRWPHERQGRVMVRSDYHHLRAQEGGQENRADRMGTGDRTKPNMWEAVWKSKIQPKVRVFAWKLLSNAIAVREGLARRGMQVRVGCPM